VEKVVLEHPAVLEVSVIGVPDPKFGEGIKAVCVLKPEARLSAQELIDFVAGRIARYKISCCNFLEKSTVHRVAPYGPITAITKWRYSADNQQLRICNDFATRVICPDFVSFNRHSINRPDEQLQHFVFAIFNSTACNFLFPLTEPLRPSIVKTA
jgi:hypothetical protein